MSASVSSPRVGARPVGARGSVATTVVTGCVAVTAGPQSPTGLVTGAPALADSGLPALVSLVLGGHDGAGSGRSDRAGGDGEAR
ncbi:hypothetical protein TN53_38420 [Streptomyces sp. WM6386]|nr:hypothetical protein TN53_38420 [Streptomyces sp. WM6386]